jgi:methylenetetrahydrofolate dehydrogenase (NADP+)/methenyltetrahydrofolate cyclohydrolase
MNFFSLAQTVGFALPNLTSQISCYEGTQCKILDGKRVAADLLSQAKNLCIGKKVPKLAVILIGEDHSSHVYVANKIKVFSQVGFLSKIIRISSEKAATEEIVTLIQELNQDAEIHGILVQLPLPQKLDKQKILSSIVPHKDVDGLLALNMGSLALGEFTNTFACTPFGIMVLLHAYGVDVKGKNAVVVGRSNLVGKPMGLLLLHADATVTITHSKTQNLKEICRQADVLVVATGKSQLVTKDFVKPGSIIVDVGIHRKSDGLLCGDVQEDVKEIAGYLSPVPGGVGPMTIAMLVVNTAIAAWKNNN